MLEIRQLEKLGYAIRDWLTDPVHILDGEQADECEEGLIHALEPVVEALATLDQKLHPEQAMCDLLRDLRNKIDIDVDIPEPDENGKAVLIFRDQSDKTKEMPALEAYEFILEMAIDQTQEAVEKAETALNHDPSEKLIRAYTETLIRVGEIGKVAVKVAISQALQMYRQDSFRLYKAIGVLKNAANIQRLREPDRRRIEAVLGAFQALASSKDR